MYSSVHHRYRVKRYCSVALHTTSNFLWTIYY